MNVVRWCSRFYILDIAYLERGPRAWEARILPLNYSRVEYGVYQRSFLALLTIDFTF